jgi:peroxygenase
MPHMDEPMSISEKADLLSQQRANLSTKSLHRSTNSQKSNGLADTKVYSASPILVRTDPSALQQHIAFFDRDDDSIIWPSDIYNGFRELGFSIVFSLGALLINVFFSYPTHLAHSYIPDPFLRIHVDSIHKAKHGSDTGIYDSDGHLRPALFDELFDKFDKSGTGGLDYNELISLLSKDRQAADPAGWSFAFMEWWTTWLLLQKDGRVWKEDLRQCYDGSLFWRIREERMRKRGWQQGYGWTDFVRSVLVGGTWKEWTLK